jgi:adenylate cyclase
VFAFADIVGYTALMSEDEWGTHKRWMTILTEMVRPLTLHHDARLIKTTGDGFLAEFQTIPDALHWALELQAASAEFVGTAGNPLNRPITFRIAIHGGYVIDTGDDLYGADVNIAARLQEHAQPGGIILSAAAFDQVREHTNEVFRKVGGLRLKNIPNAVEAYELPSKLGVLSSTVPQTVTALPSIAVLPLQDLGPGRTHQHLAEGFVEDIIVSLASLRELFVIARTSGLGIDQSTAGIRDIGRALGVRYIVRGSLRRSSNKLRIAIQLWDSETGESLWGHNEGIQQNELFEVQEEIVKRIVAGIAPNVRSSELRLVLRKRPESYSAYDCTLRGLTLIHSLRRETFVAADKYLNRAMELDPNFAMPLAWAARWRSMLIGQRWSTAPADDAKLALDLASRAIDLDRQNSLALATYGHLKSYLFHDYDVGLVYLDRALSACPNSALAWILSSATLSYIGECDRAVAHAEHALRLSPSDQSAFYYYMFLGLAHYARQDYEAAAKWGRLALGENPSYISSMKVLIAALSALRQDKEARQVARQLLALDPEFRLSEFESTLQPFRPAEIKRRYIEDLARAGLPT